MTLLKINAVTAAPNSGNDVADRFPSRAEMFVGQDGFEGYELLKPEGDREVWLIVTRWRDVASYQAWADSPAATHRSDGPDPSVPPDGHLGIASELWTYTVAASSAGS